MVTSFDVRLLYQSPLSHRFSTKDRRPLITPDYELRLYDYIGGTLRRAGGISLELNSTEDHIHLLAKLRPDRAVSDVLRDLKANASGWMHDVFPSLRNFSWQVVMERSLSANQMLRKFGDTLQVRKSTIARFRFEMSLSNF